MTGGPECCALPPLGSRWAWTGENEGGVHVVTAVRFLGGPLLVVPAWLVEFDITWPAWPARPTGFGTTAACTFVPTRTCLAWSR